MNSPATSAHLRHPDSSSGTLRMSPPGSSGGSPRGMMIHPPTPFLGTSYTSRAPGLAPALAASDPRSPGGYNSTSYSHSTSPSTASGGIPEIPANDQSHLVVSPTHVTSANLNAQKRAYRQRRKDPSCDACRERKVKCDATETTACSECSSRNHKCQFTKDTNRRMSSIKQVQDLQSQIAELQQERQHLLNRVGGQDGMELDPPPSRQQREQRLPQYFNPDRREPAPAMQNFDLVRENIRSHSTGIFQPPRHYHDGKPSDPTDRFPNIPPRAEFAHISRSYLDTIHEMYPILHWPFFQGEVNQVYTTRSFEGMSKEWVGMYFAVLSLGCLNIADGTPHARNGGTEFYDIASQAVTPWPQDPTIVHARLLFLLGLYATENNMKSAGSMWFACAARVALALSLNRSDPTHSASEAEVRKRLWWAIYVQDRLTSFCTNQPPTINEDDCEVSLPSLVHDRYMGSPNVPPNHSVSEYPFVAVIRIARTLSGIQQTLKSNRVYESELRIHGEQMQTTISQLPELCQPGSDARLDPFALLPTIVLHTARFQLHRRNISPICPPEDRRYALSSCKSIARDTAQAIQRFLQSPESDRERMRRIASHVVCIHLWRCILILCLHKDYQSALTCVRASAAMGDLRKINTACGRNILFFLEQLSERAQRENGIMYSFVDDEEMVAYASGDLQSGLEHSWAWASATRTTSPHTYAATSYQGAPRASTDFAQSTLPIRQQPPDSPDPAAAGWRGWDAVEYMIQGLTGSQKRIAPLAPVPVPAPSYYPPPHNPMKRVQLASDAPLSSPKPKPPTPSSSASRISIANII